MRTGGIGRAALLAVGAMLHGCVGPDVGRAGAAPPGVGRGAFAAFCGDHRGELVIETARGTQRVPMGLTVAPLDGSASGGERCRFVLRYGEGERAQRRDYELRLVDPGTGSCEVDEQNGIVLPGWLRDGALWFAFTVQGHTNVAGYRAVPDGIEFTLIAVEAAVGEAAGEGVLAHPGLVTQRASLRR